MPKAARYAFSASIWIYPGTTASWHFLTLPKKESAEILSLYGKQRKGWGSLPVRVTIGKTTWDTSIFPDKKASAYLLPLKATVRKQENLRPHDIANVSLVIRKA